MLELLLLAFGIIYLFRKPKLKKLKGENFPNIKSDKFDAWKRLELKAINAFLIATWGAFFIKILLSIFLQKLGLDVYIIIIFVTILWLLGLIYPAILGSKAKKLKKELGIKWPPFREKKNYTSSKKSSNNTAQKAADNFDNNLLSPDPKDHLKSGRNFGNYFTPFKIIVATALLVLAISGGYYLAFFLPRSYAKNQEQQERALELRKQELQLQQEKEQRLQEKASSDERKAAERQDNLDTCLSTADDDYSIFWDNECSAVGLKADCKLPEYNANRVDRQLREDKDACFKQYQ